MILLKKLVIVKWTCMLMVVYKQFFKFEVSGSANAISDVNNDFKLYLKLVTGAQLIPYLSTLKKLSL